MRRGTEKYNISWVARLPLLFFTFFKEEHGKWQHLQ
nr:MAG TPA: hypothetical protein [Caudoviricetes sp.]